jgi:hypothetical protein
MSTTTASPFAVSVAGVRISTVIIVLVIFLILVAIAWVIYVFVYVKPTLENANAKAEEYSNPAKVGLQNNKEVKDPSNFTVEIIHFTDGDKLHLNPRACWQMCKNDTTCKALVYKMIDEGNYHAGDCILYTSSDSNVSAVLESNDKDNTWAWTRTSA